MYKEKGSKFLSFAYPVSDEEQISHQLKSLKKEFHDARHHCYAWSLGSEMMHYRSNDDGEPKHAAGDPILGQIRSLELTNILVVVVRYFGGTKLGVGGLVNGYRTAASDALGNAEVITIEPACEFKLTYPYDQTGPVKRLVNAFDIKIHSRDFGDSCVLHGEIKERFLADFMNGLADLRDVVFVEK